MNVYPIFLSLYVIMTMRVHVSDGSDIAYRTQAEQSTPFRVPDDRSFARQRETPRRYNPRAPGLRRTVEQILFRIVFGISAGAPETDETQDERRDKREKKLKKKRATFREMVSHEGGLCLDLVDGSLE